MEAQVLVSSKNKTVKKDKKLKRKEMLEKKKAVDEIIRSASSDGKDNLSFYPPFCRYNKNGLDLHLDSGHGDKLPPHLKLYIQSLLKLNMEGPYGSEWPTEEKIKRREMVSPDTRYIFVHEQSNEHPGQITKLVDDKGPIVGFVHYRFTTEEEIPVLYVYELQLHPRVQGKGLGR